MRCPNSSIALEAIPQRSAAKRVLLIDDDDSIHFIHSRMIFLIDPEIKVFHAYNGVQGLEVIGNLNRENEDINLILIDLHMPHMDGFEFVTELKKLPGGKLLTSMLAMITSSTNNLDARKAQALGIPNYFKKPLSEAAIRSLVASSHLHALSKI